MDVCSVLSLRVSAVLLVSLERVEMLDVYGIYDVKAVKTSSLSLSTRERMNGGAEGPLKNVDWIDKNISFVCLEYTTFPACGCVPIVCPTGSG